MEYNIVGALLRSHSQIGRLGAVLSAVRFRTSVLEAPLCTWEAAQPLTSSALGETSESSMHALLVSFSMQWHTR